MKKVYHLTILIFLLTAAGCKKDTSFNKVDLMADATEYVDIYPSPTLVTYQDLGVTKSVFAYPNQIVVFFRMPTTLEAANQIVSTAGGEILAQIPSIGYYLVGAKSAQMNTLMNTLKANTFVNDALPHVAGYLRGNVAIMDYCGGSQAHDAAVLQVLKACGGTFNECIRISSNDTFTSPAKIIHGILNEAKQNAGRTTLINLSANGGLPNDVDWSTQPIQVQQQGKDEWFTFMRVVLMTIAALPEENRADLVVTIAAGNENMPIAELLAELRQSPSLEAVLKKNVLIVSTEKNNGFGNYAPLDPDVVVMNNTSAQAGTSLAAPCAMGFIDSIMRARGKTAVDVLKAVKSASWMTPNREVKFNNISAAIFSTVYYAKGPFTVTGRDNYTPNQNYSIAKHDFSEIRITYGVQNSPYVSFADCVENWTYYDDGTLYSNNYNCGVSTLWVEDSAGIVTFDPYIYQTHNQLVFKGNKSSDGSKITGNIWVDWEPTKKVYIEFLRQQ